jgi:hypothetical protein
MRPPTTPRTQRRTMRSWSSSPPRSQQALDGGGRESGEQADVVEAVVAQRGALAEVDAVHPQGPHLFGLKPRPRRQAGRSCSCAARPLVSPAGSTRIRCATSTASGKSVVNSLPSGRCDGSRANAYRKGIEVVGRYRPRGSTPCSRPKNPDSTEQFAVAPYARGVRRSGKSGQCIPPRAPRRFVLPDGRTGPGGGPKDLPRASEVMPTCPAAQILTDFHRLPTTSDHLEGPTESCAIAPGDHASPAGPDSSSRVRKLCLLNRTGWRQGLVRR